ncbi:RF-1 domain-containing protein [Lipomyces kononenkoae]|uniref:RF-1 domain-containing protein n=1 Tax=Lipomyces kononenkoae TaxID=34357 RepID=A0ACC3T9W2_LIPKO
MNCFVVMRRRLTAVLSSKTASKSLVFHVTNRLAESQYGNSYSELPAIRSHARTISSSTPRCKKDALPPRPSIPEDEIEEVFIKGGGKGGQKINKTNSKVQLRHIPTGLVVSSQATRSREQNRKLARRELAEELEFLQDPENSRRGQKIKQLQKKKAQQRKKAIRRDKERRGLEPVEELEAIESGAGEDTSAGSDPTFGEDTDMKDSAELGFKFDLIKGKHNKGGDGGDSIN